jgi:hypothetical protein
MQLLQRDSELAEEIRFEPRAHAQASRADALLQPAPAGARPLPAILGLNREMHAGSS